MKNSLAIPLKTKNRATVWFSNHKSVSQFLFCKLVHLYPFFPLDSTYKWWHMIFVFLCLTYFSKYDNLHPSLSLANGIISFFLMAKYYIVNLYHIFFYPFICWWILRLFLCLGYCKPRVMNTGVPVSFWIKVFSGYMPRSEIAESYCSSIFCF